jgi:hypothetical protein
MLISKTPAMKDKGGVFMGNALARKTNFARVLGQTEKVAEYDAAAKKLLANIMICFPW